MRTVHAVFYGVLAVMLVGLMGIAFWGVGTPAFLRHDRVFLLLADAWFGGLLVYGLFGVFLTWLWPALDLQAVLSFGSVGLLVVFGFWFPHSAAFGWWIRHVQSRAVGIFRGYIVFLISVLIVPRVVTWAAERF